MKIEMQQEVTLRPELELELQQTASMVLDLNAQKKMIDVQLDVEKSTLDRLQKEVGIEKFESGEYKFALTGAGGGTLSEAILLAVGVSPTLIAKAKAYAATIPKKKYVKVTRKSDRDVTEHD
jgi:hypothetical protein